MSTQYTLHVIRLEDLQWKRLLHSATPDLYIEAQLGGKTRKTRTIGKSKSPVWNESLMFSTSDTYGSIIIRLMHESSWKSDPCVGYVKISLADLLERCTSGEAHLRLSPPSGQASAEPAGSLILHLEVSDVFAGANEMLDMASQDVRESSMVHSETVRNVANLLNDQVSQKHNGSDLYKAVGQLLSKLDALRNVIDAVSEIHPFLTIAWGVTSGLLQVVSRVFETDAKIVGLVLSMQDAFTFVDDLKKLHEKVNTVQEPVIGLLKQTVECCVFIREYSSHGFAKRMFDISSSGKVDEFEKALADLKAKIGTGVILHTAVVSLRTSERVDILYLQQALKPSLSDTFDRPVCLAGTRSKVQTQILEWIFSDARQNVLWLHGVAGSGKSTVCTTISHHLRRVSRLGAYIFFEGGKSEPSTVVRTLAYKLASFDSSIASGVLCAIDRDKEITAASPMDQFNELIKEPLVATANSLPGPVVIVFDALDECGTPSSRRGLMPLLRQAFSTLPANFRFVITSRPEHDIETAFSSLPDNVQRLELDYTSSSSQEDVLLYIKNEMLRVINENVRIPPNWPWDGNMELLSKTAGGLFIWASTAVKLVSTSDNPFATLEELVNASYSSAEFGLSQLYDSVLRNCGILWAKDVSRLRFQKVMGLLLLNSIPLSAQAIDGILGFQPQESSLLIISKLRCLLTCSQEGPVRLFHASFSDYLLSPERKNDSWFIDISAQQQFITTRCFSIMEDSLRFNICGLASSFVRNDDVPDLMQRVKSCIPSHLHYACVHWSYHLCEAPYSPDLLSKLSDFAYSRLLFWFEVLSVIKAFRLTSPALLDASRWAAESGSDVSSFLTDSSKLASEFTFPIAQSTPHIYVSMIPLTMIDSEVSAHYSKRMSSLVHVERRGIKRPPRWLRVLEGHRDWVYSVAVSADGTRIASASGDRTVRIWNYNSGEEAFPPLVGHSQAVYCVCFSSDGMHLVSGSQDDTLRIWNTQDGSPFLGPLERHSDSVISVAYSPDGEKIVSGSFDKTIIIWNALNGDIMAGPLKYHTDAVRSVAFSPDGSRLASGSHDATIRIWNVKNGEPVLEPFTGHDNKVNSIAFSPDGGYIVSGSQDLTIRKWEVKSGTVVYGPVHGHTNAVTCVAYSPCGTRIVSGSSDSTIRVWDANSGRLVSGPLEGHAATVSAVAFSPDGACILSGSRDATARIWTTTPVEAEIGSFSGHKGVVTCVQFSTDGSRVASASGDRSIVIWNAHSGEVVAGPFVDHSQAVNGIAFSSDSSRLVSGSDDCKVRILDVESGKIICTMEGHTDEVWCVALSPDNTQIVSGSRDGTIRVWSMDDGRLVAGPLKEHTLGIWSIVFSPDGRRLASGSEDRTIGIWDIECWQTISEPFKRHEAAVESVCFSPDSKRIASASVDCTIILWDAESGEVLGGPFCAHTNWVRSVIFSHDGRHLLSSSEDQTIRVCNIETGETICQPLEGHLSGVYSLALSPDGTRLASGSFDNTIRVWDLSSILGRAVEEDDAESESINNENSLDWVLGENGWIIGGHDRRELLVWIPPDLRRTLWSPRNTAVFSCEFSMKVDFTGAARGERWTGCFETVVSAE